MIYSPRIPVALIVWTLCSCACVSSSTHTGTTSASLNSSYDAAFYAVLDVFEAHDFSPETVDYEAGRISARGDSRLGAPYRVVQARAHLSEPGDAAQLRLFLTFQGQAAERPRPVPRRKDRSRVWEYTTEGLDRSRRATYAYGYYVEAIRERIRELQR